MVIVVSSAYEKFHGSRAGHFQQILDYFGDSGVRENI
jgi:hypothetical protein